MALNLQFDLRAIKEPRGFIRILQVVFAILAFSTTAGFNTSSAVKASGSFCPGDTVLEYTIEYPFSKTYSTELSGCLKPGEHKFTLDNKASSQFYVTVGVLTMLYALAALVLYILFIQIYESNQLIPFFDLAGTGILAVFTFIGWCAWVANVGNVKNFVYGLENEVKKISNDGITVYDKEYYKFTVLTISLVFGFANIILWVASCWFVFKETQFHKKDEQSLGPNSTASHPQQVPA